MASPAHTETAAAVPMPHVPTVMAAAVVAYALANLLHEGAGHGGACLLLGHADAASMLNAIFFDYNSAAVPVTHQKIIASAGTVANLMAAAAGWALTRALRRAGPWPVARFALWLFVAINLMDAFGYLLFSGVLGVGDWVKVTGGWQPAAVWRTALALVGAGLYFGLTPRLIMPGLWPFVGGGPDREQRAKRLCLTAYLTGGALYVVAGLFNPYGLQLVLISAAAASLGGTSLLAWFPDMKARKTPATGDTPVAVGPSRRWMVAGAVAAALFVAVLGPGVGHAPKLPPADAAAR